MKTSDLLINAKALINTPDKWTQGHFARDRLGLEISPRTDQAVCFCSLGAMMRVNYDEPYIPAVKALGRAITGDDTIGYYGAFQAVHEFNDKHTHAEVMGMFDKAIAKEAECQAPA